MARGVGFLLGFRQYPFLKKNWPGIPVFGYCPFFFPPPVWWYLFFVCFFAPFSYFNSRKHAGLRVLTAVLVGLYVSYYIFSGVYVLLYSRTYSIPIFVPVVKLVWYGHVHSWYVRVRANCWSNCDTYSSPKRARGCKLVPPRVPTYHTALLFFFRFFFVGFTYFVFHFWVLQDCS